MTNDLPKWKRAAAIFHREPWWAEFWAAVGALNWAIWSALIPVGPDQIPAFHIVTRLAGEVFWQVSGALLGALQIAALVVNSRNWRRGTCFLGSWWWMFLLLAIALANTSTPSLALYAVMAAINLFSLVRLRRELP